MNLGKLSAMLMCGSLLAVGATANADTTIPFSNLTFTNTTGNPDYLLAIPSGGLVGTLTAVQADFVLDSQTGGVWASDLGVFITDLGTIMLDGDGGTGVYQAGGFNSWGSTQYSDWGTGTSSTLGTPVVTTLTLANPITFTGTGSDPNVFLAHLWNSNSEGTWNGTITLVGVIPEPTSAALGLVGLAAFGLKRRRMA